MLLTSALIIPPGYHENLIQCKLEWLASYRHGRARLLVDIRNVHGCKEPINCSETCI